MWCKTCRIETNEELCPICGSVTIEDLPIEVYLRYIGVRIVPFPSSK